MEMDKADDETRDDYLLARNILLKNYQTNIAERAKKKNTIIYLPTGAGKTLIAISVLCSKTKDFLKPYNEGGKIAFFLANTKLLTYQLAEVLQCHTKFKITYFNGDMNTDSWNRDRWSSHFEKNQVIVLTGEIFKQILLLKFINISSINLIVFDECHHAVADHPYRLILQFISDDDSPEKPLLLGLSAVLLNSSPKNEQVIPLIQSLESAFRGEVVTDTDFEEILSLATDPIEKAIVYQKASVSETFTELYNDVINVLRNLVLKPIKDILIPEEGIDFKCRNKAKRIANGLVLAKDHIKELGLYGGSLSTLFYIILFEKYRLMSDNDNEIDILIYARTELNKIRRILLKAVGEENSTSILQFSSPKVQKLIQLIVDNNEKFKGKPISTIIFVHKRATAIILAFLLKRLSAVEEKFSFIKADFLIGSSQFCKDIMFLGCKTDEILKKFANNSINVLFATNILEEGIDISGCNVVISFDFPLSYSSYFQSKGRARNKNSFYYLFMEETEVFKKTMILKGFQNIGEALMENICTGIEKIEVEEKEELETEQITVGKEIIVHGTTAIKVVYRYCTKLPQDRFSFLSPSTWYIVNKNKQKKAFLQLPFNCPLHDVVEGKWRENKKLARRSVFLETIKKLYEIGELNDDLSFNSFAVKESSFGSLFPHYKTENIDASLPQPGTKKRKQVYRLKFAESLSYCLPTSGNKVYLHVIDLTLAFDKPELDYKVAVYDILRYPVTFAILSSKKLCKILRFPLFLDMGQINCNFLVNYDEFILTETEINDIKLCHFALFQKAICGLKNSQIFDNRNEEYSFYVVPVQKNEEDRFVLSWDLIRSDFCKISNLALVTYNPTNQGVIKREPGSSEETPNQLIPRTSVNNTFSSAESLNEAKFEYTEAQYKYFVVVPIYRKLDPPQYYIVNKLCYDMSPLSPFPRVDYTNYLHYYQDKYFITVTNTTQPLLKVSPLYGCSNFNKPRMRKRRNREKFKEYEEHFIPELCDVIPFDRRYWVKALLLPTILNRISHIYYVEEFRRKIVAETGLGSCELPEGEDWKPLVVDETCVNEEEEGVKTTCANTADKVSLPLSKLKDETQRKNEIILDPERHMYEIGLCDLEFYVKCLKELNSLEEEGGRFHEAKIMAQNELMKLTSMKNMQVPTLKILTYNKNKLGPDLADMIKACTAKCANDIINFERLETLGDSFLKFATTVFLFRNFSENEDILTILKGKIVGNRNLMYCGLAKGIQDVVNVTDFVPLFDWRPPLLCIPERLVDEIISNNIDPAVHYRFEIPFEEQFSGVLSEATLEKNEEIIKSHNKCWEMPANSLLPYKSVEDKTVADCVEAFIGAYLFALGLFGAFEFILWLEILPKEKASYSELIEKPYVVSLQSPNNDPRIMMLLDQVFYSDLEDVLNYRFKNKALLLEAITHPSYSRNRITNCYQRLELLGDAVIDFIITIYIYESCNYLKPGEITDIRSSLVNNITFACIVVRYELHKYLLSFSSTLNKVIENFVSFQINRNHVVDDNVLILLNEEDCIIGESVLVPKALGDLFESLAGAIYLDSGNSLETVWEIYYKLMKREIDDFTKVVPKTPVRLLQEICGDKPYYESKVIRNFTKVTCTVYYENREITAHAFAVNKNEGKRSAAKLVLNKILALKKINEQ